MKSATVASLPGRTSDNELRQVQWTRSGRPLFLLSVLIIGGCNPPWFGTRNRSWEKFPQPPGRPDGVSSISLDRHGELWIISGQGTYYWNAKTATWGGPLLGPAQHLTHLYGGNRGTLYATQRGKKEHLGRIYALEHGQAVHVTDFYYDTSSSRPGFYVTDDDRLLNWGGGKLRIFSNGKWAEHAADLPQSRVIVFDGRNTVALLYAGHLYTIDRHNRVTETVAFLFIFS